MRKILMILACSAILPLTAEIPVPSFAANIRQYTGNAWRISGEINGSLDDACRKLTTWLSSYGYTVKHDIRNPERKNSAVLLLVSGKNQVILHLLQQNQKQTLFKWGYVSK